jgi:hypothetical protein
MGLGQFQSVDWEPTTCFIGSYVCIDNMYADNCQDPLYSKFCSEMKVSHFLSPVPSTFLKSIITMCCCRSSFTGPAQISEGGSWIVLAGRCID